MKYIIDIPSELLIKDDGYSFSDGKSYCITGNLSKLTPYAEPDRKAIEDEVWNFVDFMIHEMDVEEREECFGESAYAVCIHELTYQGAKAEYDEWKKQKDEIRVGDEVIPIDVNYDTMIVTRIWRDDHSRDCLDTLGLDGSICSFLTSNVKKTGRHFPEVAQLLYKMRGKEGGQ